MWVTLHKARRRFTEEAPRGRGAEEWQALHLVADKGYAQLWSLVVQILREAGDDLDRGAILRALEAHDIATVQHLLEDALSGMAQSLQETIQPVLESVTQNGAQASLDALEQVVGAIDETDIEAIFGRVNREATDYAERRSAQLVRDVDESTRQGVRDIITRAINDGASPTQTMNDLQEMIGLTDKQAQSVKRYRDTVVAEGKPAKTVQELVTRRIDQIKRQRAENITRTETIDAASEGQQQLWQHAEPQGIIPPNMRRFWIVTPDDRLCQICAPIPRLNREGVGLHEPFETPIGPKLQPTAHPQCRCSVSLRRVAT